MNHVGRPMPQRASSCHVQTLLESAGFPPTIQTHAPTALLFVQGAPADRVLYLQRGRVTLLVRGSTGRNAVVDTLGPGEFCGEECLLADPPSRRVSARALTATCVLAIEKEGMRAALRAQRSLSDYLIAQLLTRHIRLEQRWRDHQFGATDAAAARRLARATR
jgi:CRP/FNR family cyclic AMP-dependent transcriptional regulator